MDEALFCDRIALMDAGRISAEDTPAALVARPLPTPLLVLHSKGGTRLAKSLRQWPEVLEIIPHAGQLRIRLQHGANVEAVTVRIRELAAAQGIALDALAPAEPELEDVFVALLEEHQAQRRRGEAS
jgi:ABC-2 type transport system ATP-binding protein